MSDRIFYNSDALSETIAELGRLSSALDEICLLYTSRCV